MSRVRLTVTVDDAHLGQADAVADDLAKQGLTVEYVSPRSGAIFGSGDAAKLTAFKSVEGVSNVRSSNDFQLPAMGETVPQ